MWVWAIQRAKYASLDYCLDLLKLSFRLKKTGIIYFPGMKKKNDTFWEENGWYMERRSMNGNRTSKFSDTTYIDIKTSLAILETYGNIN